MCQVSRGVYTQGAKRVLATNYPSVKLMEIAESVHTGRVQQREHARTRCRSLCVHTLNN